MKAHRLFAAAKDTGGDLLLYLYDEIGESFWSQGITAKAIAQEIGNAGKPTSITLRINSPGGDVFEGLAIMNLVRSQGVPVTVMVDGLAASAASVIAMAGDRIVMADNALLMIHNAWSVAVGDAAEMRKTADLLDKVSGTLRDTYARRSGQPADAVASMMDAETWLTAQEAVDLGLATEIFEQPQEEAAAAKATAATFNLAQRFRRAPAAFASPAAAGSKPAAAAPAPAPPDLGRLERDLLSLELSAIA